MVYFFVVVGNGANVAALEALDIFMLNARKRTVPTTM
jgi:hypothetical protein